MAFVIQAPASLSLQGVQGDPFAVTFGITVVDSHSNPVLWGSVTAPTVLVTGTSPTYPEVVELVASEPTISTSTNSIRLSWSALQTADFGVLDDTNWSLSVTVSGTGPLALLAGSLGFQTSTFPFINVPTATPVAIEAEGYTFTVTTALG